jgi:uncharacterized membrane protein (UPF0127 family)
MRRVFIAAMAAAGLLACGEKPSTMEDLTSTTVTFPNGTRIIAQAMRERIDLTRGMMFRDSLAADHGMLFFHGRMGRYTYWTYQTRIPLDFIWMDRDHRIVEMAVNIPPCPSKAAHECPNYGGNQDASYVLEVNAGIATKNGLKVGDRLDF